MNENVRHEVTLQKSVIHSYVTLVVNLLRSERGNIILCTCMVLI